jgi:hypothetical protein
VAVAPGREPIRAHGDAGLVVEDPKGLGALSENGVAVAVAARALHRQLRGARNRETREPARKASYCNESAQDRISNPPNEL